MHPDSHTLLSHKWYKPNRLLVHLKYEPKAFREAKVKTPRKKPRKHSVFKAFRGSINELFGRDEGNEIAGPLMPYLFASMSFPDRNTWEKDQLKGISPTEKLA